MHYQTPSCEGRVMPSEYPDNESFDRFLNLIETLYQHVEAAREKRCQEYLALGRSLPTRIKFEDLDLSRHMSEMLSVQKTLQWRSHNHRLGHAAPKARLVAIAGVCEFIKNDYLGRFWESYKSLIGWGADTTVYNWLWQVGFREEGIELIISSSGRREFVQSLILESGIPKRRIGDIIDFFVIYYRYLRSYTDVDALIANLAEGTLLLPVLSGADSLRLREICKNAADYSHTFALVVHKLIRVFEFIEHSGEVVSNNIRDYTELIHERTGIHPLEILRDADQLERLYNRLLGYVTPARLKRILAALSPGTSVRLPSGSTFTAGKYRYVQYGEHIIGRTVFTCVPAPGLRPERLEDLPYNDLIRTDGGWLYKSWKKLKVTIGGYERFDVVHRFYTKSRGVVESKGVVFFSELPPAADLVIRGEDGMVLKTVAPENGSSASVSFGYFGNHEQHRHGLKIDIHRFRFHSPSFASQNLRLVTDSVGDKPFIFTVDKNGSCGLEDRYMRIRNPRPGRVSVHATQQDDLKEVMISGKAIGFTVDLAGVMLFSPVHEWQISPMKRDTTSRFGHQYLVLYVAAEMADANIQLQNLRINGESEIGQYRALSLEWVERNLGCAVEVFTKDTDFCWRFEQYAEYTLSISKIQNSSYKGIQLGDKEGRQAEDFSLSLSPVPGKEAQHSLFWNIVVNDGMPVLTRLEDGPAGQITAKGLEFKSEHFAQLIQPAVEGQLTGITRVEISLSTAGHILATDRMWLFPDLDVEMKSLFKEGEPVQALVRCGARHIPIILKDSSGNREARLELTVSEDRWQLELRNYSSEIIIPDAGIRWDLQTAPRVAGCRLGSRTSGKTEVLRNMLRRELKEYDLLIAPGLGSPAILLEEKPLSVACEVNGDLCILNLAKLDGLSRPKNSISIKTPSLQCSFDVLYRVAVSHVKIHETMIADTILGEVSFSGPQYSGLRFIVYEEEAEEGKKLTSLELLAPLDDALEEQTVSIKLPGQPLPGKKYLVKLYLIPDVRDRCAVQEYGQSWAVVYQQRDIGPSGIIALIAAIESEIGAGRYFRAKNLLAGLGTDPLGEHQTKVTTLAEQIELLLCRKKLRSVIQQTRRVLKKEYSMDI